MAEGTVLKDWTKEEKYDLLVALKNHGSKNLKELKNSLPEKTPEQIKIAINYYRNEAIKSKSAKQNNNQSSNKHSQFRRPRYKPRIPLARWAKLLTDSVNFKDLETETIAAVRLLANFDKLPAAANTDQIDFRKVYHQLADAMEGKSLSNDQLVTEVIKYCLIDTVLMSKPFIRPSAFKNIINSVNLSDKDRNINYFPWPTKNNEKATLRHLISQRNYNPLCITEDFLTPSSHTTSC